MVSVSVAIAIVVIIAVIVIIVVRVTVLIVMRSPTLPLALPPLSLSLPWSRTHVHRGGESHARLNHVGWDVTRVPVSGDDKNDDQHSGNQGLRYCDVRQAEERS